MCVVGGQLIFQKERFAGKFLCILQNYIHFFGFIAFFLLPLQFQVFPAAKLQRFHRLKQFCGI